MTEFRIFVKATEETFTRSQTSSNPVGLIHVEFDDEPYPSQNWDDFVLPVLNGWLATSTYLAGAVVELDARFMDGPYAFAIRRERRQPISESVLTIRCYASYRPDPKMPEVYEVSYRAYLEALINAASDLLTQLEDGGVTGKNNTEVRRLEEQLGKVVQFYQENMVEEDYDELEDTEEQEELP